MQQNKTIKTNKEVAIESVAVFESRLQWLSDNRDLADTKEYHLQRVRAMMHALHMCRNNVELAKAYYLGAVRSMGLVR